MQTLQPGDATTLPTTFSLVGFTIQILLNKNRRNIYLPHVSNPLYSFHFVSSFLWSVSTFVPMWENAKFEGWADHVTGNASEGFRAWCNEYIPRLVTWSTHWLCATFGHYVIDFSVNCMHWYTLFITHIASLDHWIVQSGKCTLRLKFHQPTFMTRQYVGTQFIFVSQPCTPYICNTKSNLKGTVFILKKKKK